MHGPFRDGQLLDEDEVLRSAAPDGAAAEGDLAAGSDGKAKRGVRGGAKSGGKDGARKPRRRLTQAERTALSDTRMFNAAMQLISEQGANKTTLKEICETAGYSRGLASYRFGSKDIFLQELLKHFNRAWADQLTQYVAGKTGIDAFLAAIDALENFLVEYHRYMRGGYIIWYESIGSDNEVRDALRHNHQVYREDLAGWLRQAAEQGEVDPDLDVENFAIFYNSIVAGTIYQWLVDPEAIDLKEFFGYVRGVVKGILRRT